MNAIQLASVIVASISAVIALLSIWFTELRPLARFRRRRRVKREPVRPLRTLREDIYGDAPLEHERQSPPHARESVPVRHVPRRDTRFISADALINAVAAVVAASMIAGASLVVASQKNASSPKAAPPVTVAVPITKTVSLLPPGPSAQPAGRHTMSTSSSPTCQRREQYRVTLKGEVRDPSGNGIGDAEPGDLFLRDLSVAPPPDMSDRYFGTLQHPGSEKVTGFVLMKKLDYERTICV